MSLQGRVLRLVKLAKLLRIFRVSKFMAAVESSLSVKYGLLDLMKFICIIVLSAHWMACLCLLFTRIEVSLLPSCSANLQA